MKEILPHKLVIHYDDNGEAKKSVLIYRLKIDGVIKNEYYTTSVNDAIKQLIKIPLQSAVTYAETGEKIIKGDEYGLG